MDQTATKVHFVVSEEELNRLSATGLYERVENGSDLSGPTCLVLDLGGVALITSWGMGSFIRMVTKLEPAGGSLTLMNVDPHISSCLRISGLDQMIKIVEAKAK